MSHKIHEHGSILYVSRTGNNLAPRKSDPERPWKDPWTAAAAASAGDVIHVHPGTWTLTDTAGGGDVEFADQNDADTLAVLCKEGLTFYFEPETYIDDQSSFQPIIFSPGFTAVVNNFKVLGHLTYLNHKANQIFNFGSSNGEFHWEFDRVETVGNFDIFEFGTLQNMDITMRVKHHLINSVNPLDRTSIAEFDGTGVGGNFGNRINIRVDKLQSISGQIFQYVILEAIWQTTYLDVYIGNVDAVCKGECLFGLNFQIGSTITGNRINYRVGNIRHQDPRILDATYSTYTLGTTTHTDDDNLSTDPAEIPAIFGIGNSWGGGTASATDNQVNIEVGNADISGTLLGRLFFGPNTGNAPQDNYITCTVGNLISRNGSPCFLPQASNGTGFADDNAFKVNVYVLGRAIADNEVIWGSNETSERVWAFRGGEYISKGTGTAVINTTASAHEFDIQNCILRNDGTVAAITSDVAVTHNIYSSYANSVLSDGDVTEAIDGLTKNAAV